MRRCNRHASNTTRCDAVLPEYDAPRSRHPPIPEINTQFCILRTAGMVKWYHTSLWPTCPELDPRYLHLFLKLLFSATSTLSPLLTVLSRIGCYFKLILIGFPVKCGRCVAWAAENGVQTPAPNGSNPGEGQVLLLVRCHTVGWVFAVTPRPATWPYCPLPKIAVRIHERNEAERHANATGCSPLRISVVSRGTIERCEARVATTPTTISNQSVETTAP
jgi:hypothetical protein